MGNVLRHLGWLLLVPEPSEEVQRRASIRLFLVAGVVCVVFGVVRLLQTSPDIAEVLRLWALALLVFVQGLLCSPSLYRRPRAMLGARAITSVVTFAVTGVIALTFYAEGFRLGVVLVVAFPVFILCFYCFANRRRYRRSRPE
jgi:O-antigen/teichoic acid export membrane protein